MLFLATYEPLYTFGGRHLSAIAAIGISHQIRHPDFEYSSSYRVAVVGLQSKVQATAVGSLTGMMDDGLGTNLLSKMCFPQIRRLSGFCFAVAKRII